MTVSSRGVTTSLRLSAALKAHLQKAADDGSRSLHSEIVHRLEQSFASKPALQGEIAALIEQYVQDEVQHRLKLIGMMINTEV